jgi:hypothetical protein
MTREGIDASVKVVPPTTTPSADFGARTEGEELKAGFRAAGRAPGLILDLRIRVRGERDDLACRVKTESNAPLALESQAEVITFTPN